MKNVVKLKYSKISGQIAIIFILFLVSISLPHLIKFYQKNDTIDWILIAIFDIVFLIMAIFVVKLYLLPGLRGETAIELNDIGIIDNIRKRQVTWDNISGIRLVYSQTKSAVAIDIKDESHIKYNSKNFINKYLATIAKIFRGTPFLITTQYIQGKDSEIFKQIQDYYQEKTAPNIELS